MKGILAFESFRYQMEAKSKICSINELFDFKINDSVFVLNTINYFNALNIQS